MPLSAGSRLGPYEILAPLGAGGMGEVYRARDLKLNRDVAIKVLLPAVANDPDRLARFSREAQVLASLNHPNIAHIHGLEDSDGVRALVMELVEGPTLADRIAHGAIPLDEVLPIAEQIAEGLEAAHERGIVHRDLKPANIKITPGGMVKVLDFGLARVSDGLAPELTHSPTIMGPTGEGMVMGTAPYMSPEQARGKAVDKRTDIWAFGCVLYELLTGRLAFPGGTVSDTVVAILTREPDWAALPSTTPTRVRRLLERCLRKDPTQRLHDIADARIELADLQQAQPLVAEGPRAAPVVGTRRSRLPLLAAAMAAIVAGAGMAALYLRRAPETGPATRLSISAPGQITPQLSVAVSPDGRRLAFVSTDADGRSMLWIRALDSLEPRAVPGTENAAHPFWSPDGRSLAFIAAGRVKRVDADGGSVQTLAETVSRLGGAWNRDGVIIFSPAAQQLATVPASGGPVSHLAMPGAWPSLLPDGRHFLYHSQGSGPKSRGVYVGSLDSTETKQLITSDFKGAYAAPGYLLFVQDETLMGQSFDAGRLALRGDPFVVADSIWGAAAAAQASFSVSPTGALAYVNATLFNRQVLAVDRRGRPQGPVTPPDRYFNQIPQLSPSGQQLAIARGRASHDSVWLFDRSTGASSRLTLNPDWSNTPVWSSDGARVVFMSGRGPGVPGSRLNLKTASGIGEDDVLLEFKPPVEGALWDWSSDGRFVVYSVFSPETKGVADLWVLPLDGARKPYPFLQSAFHKTQAQIAPNGRWVAYTSYESGKDEVYVQSFPTPGNKRQISIDGGVQPRWRRDGAELFYLATTQYLMAVPVKADGPFQAGPPVPLFRTKLLPQGSQSIVFATAYDVTADGERFVLTVPPDDPGPPITVVLNWIAAGRK